MAKKLSTKALDPKQTIDIDHDPHEQKEETAAVQQPEKKKVGRKKVKAEGEYKTINISVPVVTLEKIQGAVSKNKGLTAYINKLIEDDLKVNYEKYREIEEMLNS